MSSHHFVKEDQEPALLIIDPRAISFEKVQELLEWSPTVVVFEEVLETVLGWGIKIDMVLCQESKVESLRNALIDQEPIRFIIYFNASEIISSGYYFLKTAHYKAVNILIGQIADLELAQTFSGLDVEVFYNQKRWVYISKRKFEKWLPQNTQLAVYPNVLLSRTNLDEELRCLEDGMVSIQSEHSLWIGQELL